MFKVELCTRYLLTRTARRTISRVLFHRYGVPETRARISASGVPAWQRGTQRTALTIVGVADLMAKLPSRLKCGNVNAKTIFLFRVFYRDTSYYRCRDRYLRVKTATSYIVYVTRTVDCEMMRNRVVCSSNV